MQGKPGGERLDIDKDGALPREFQGIANEIEQDLAQPAGIPCVNRDRPMDRPHGKVEPGRVGTRREQFRNFAGELQRAEVFRLEFDRRGIKACIIEHIVQQVEQASAGEADRLGIFALGRRKVGFKQQRHCAEDAVQGRADFMAGGCQEGLFRRIGLGGAAGRRCHARSLVRMPEQSLNRTLTVQSWTRRRRRCCLPAGAGS